MLILVVRDGAPAAELPGYSIAGMPGTAKISTAVAFEEGRNAKILSFIGFLPADDPQVAVMVKMDRPDADFGHQVAAPLFRRIADRLVILLEIPDDNVRARLTDVEANLNGSNN